MGSIYIIRNIINNKSYIGQTIQDWERRVKCHFWEANRKEHEETKLNRAILKYGKDNFVWKLITNCDEYQLDNKEIFFIKVFNSYKQGYNSTIGGQGISNFKVSEKTKSKIREFQIKYNSDPKIKERKKNQMLGKNHHQYNKFGLNNKNFGLVRKKTLDNIDTIIEIRNKKYQGIKSKELSILYNKCIKTIDNWCGPDFEKYGGPTTTKNSIKKQSENRRKKLVMNRAVNRLDGDGLEEISLSPMKA
jgi:group I intron endonuclease